jgi:hypothetical protein
LHPAFDHLDLSQTGDHGELEARQHLADGHDPGVENQSEIDLVCLHMCIAVHNLVHISAGYEPR